MGIHCSRRSIHADEDDLEDWFLIALPEEIREDVIRLATTPLVTISRAKGRWVREIIKIWIVRHFRILWSRAGSCLNPCWQ